MSAGEAAAAATEAVPVEDVSSALYAGTLQHRRREPEENDFRYGVYQLLLNLDEIPELASRIPIFGHNGFNLTSFHDVDHLWEEERPVREKLSRWLGERGRELPGGPVLLLTNARVLGYVFNPVSYFYCLDPAGRVRFVVAEVSNTFGERYAYLLDRPAPGAEPGPGGAVISDRKKLFHVSPFMDIEGLEYRWMVGAPGQELAVHIDVLDGERTFFDATLRLERRPLETGTLARAMARHPHMTARTIFHIHWQALKLWVKGVPVRSKPAPPEGVLREREDR
ncbi:MAG: DUF1365 domain-containing protein [Candidatus Palauibacterales bacterium]|nr:DUF1365 domain-containing protein [Candidatus Palauibacterales bacterium]